VILAKISCDTGQNSDITGVNVNRYIACFRTSRIKSVEMNHADRNVLYLMKFHFVKAFTHSS
jgi:hypothetical protein